MFHHTENTILQSKVNIQEIYLKTDISLDDSTTTVPLSLPSPSLERGSTSQRPRMKIAFLCNPNDEESNIRGHGILENNIEKGCDGKLIM